MKDRLILIAVAALALLSAAVPGRGEEVRTASCRRGPVTVYSAPRDRATACRVAEVSEQLHRRIRSRLGLLHEVAVSVYIITRRPPPSTVPLSPEALDPWLAGVALSDRQAIVIRMKPGQTASDHHSLLAHELAHVIIRKDYPRSAFWPSWFQEGLAMRESGGEGLRSRAVLSIAAFRKRLLPLDRIWTSFPDNEAESRLAYAQSFSVLSFLLSRHGEDRFLEFLQALRTLEFSDAFSHVYRQGLGRMEKDWRRHVERRYGWVPILTGGTAFWLLILALFFVSLAVRRRRSRELHRQWEEEERELW
jgi:hypothetical protein